MESTLSTTDNKTQGNKPGELNDQLPAGFSNSSWQAEPLIKSITTDLPIGIAVFTGPSFTVDFANNTYLHLVDRSHDSLIGRPLFEAMPELRGQEAEKLLNYVLQTGQSCQGSEFETQLVREGKKQNVCFNFVYNPLRDDKGNYNGIMVVANEVTGMTERKYPGDVSSERMRPDDTAMLAAIIQSSEDAIVSKTLAGIITSWNPGAEKIFGFAAKEMIGESITKIIPADRLNEEPQIIKRIMAGEKVEHFDTIRRRKDGKLIDISLTISPIRDRFGQIIGASKIARDITVQKSLNTALHESEQRLHIAVQTAELGTWELNLKTREPIYSDRYLEIFGFDKSGKPSHDELLTHIHPEDRPLREKAIVNALRTGILDMELRIVHADKSVHWIKGRGKVFYDSDNNPERMLGTVLDITEQKRAFSSLQESELLFKTIANVSPVGLWMTDPDGNNNFVNDTWIEWTGVPLQEQYGGGWLTPVLKEDIETVAVQFRKASALRDYFISEFRIKRKDGQVRWCLSEGFPFFNNKGEFEGYAGSVTDITDRKMVEAELEQKVSERTQELHLANTALEKSNSELEQFAYIASHDLQEPLRKIKTFVGRMQEQEKIKDDPKASVYMEKIVNASGRMSDLIRDLLEYSRTAKVTEEHVMTDLNEVLKNVLSDFEVPITQKNAVVKSDSLPSVNAVPHQMDQLFTNLISNCLKFSKENIPPVITITCRDVDKDETILRNLDITKLYKEIVISDNGIGFSNEFSERIFEIFQRLNPRHAYTGSGIGLSICRKIVANHHGAISADSSEGEGSSFYITLPVR